MKKIIYSLIILIISTHSFAQEIVPDTITSTESSFAIIDDNMVFVRELVRLGDSLFYELDQPDEAFKYYMGAYDFISEEGSINIKIGQCFLASVTEQKADAVFYLEKALQLNETISSDLFYDLGRAYQFDEKWNEAIKYYHKSYNALDSSKYEVIDKKIKECQYARTFYDFPNEHIIIKNLGPEVNSKYSDFCPLVDAVEDDLYFTSRRHEFRTDNPDILTHLTENIYHSHRSDYVNWATPYPIPMNTDDHSATVSISMDGSEMIIYRDGDLLLSIKEDTSWSKPKKLPSQINTTLSVETSACLNYTMDTLYFVSNREDLSIGGLDVMMSIKDKNGKWGEATSLGETINTAHDEEGVALSRDGNTLYFSSRGHNSMGGYDVFKSTRDFQGNWSTPENLGTPINSPYDDVYFMIRANGRHAYYSSARKGGYGEKDIYRISILDSEKELSTAKKDIAFILLDKDSINMLHTPQHTDHLKDMRKVTVSATADLLRSIYQFSVLSKADSVNHIE
ncbi:tetratricopeptide repeat protein [Flammeovirga kamogawensis]|uniref:Tetratricopeptide repeat protein n=1 Tax=Flammeovirga kamogawensis TaxID=373891 RepID=A0ABX8GWG3_9BACT|nr:tetratricopeptide repeat protein [Flammeovirga kamogawensis]MBB6461609.1 hypothetical protein [Flammeovirga kamogawensis]QWG07462.1 tetratricopeptide repeat protein [Flammeovirga kamogawensis]TRX69274.1 tetratricopeptide repeat protein [Flammeovirga kamogawensis]